METTFKQKSKVGVAGSFINQLMGNNSTLPEVGKGATELHYTDRTCYEVIEVSKDFKTVKLEALDVEARIKPSPMGHQDWILKPTGRFTTVVWRNNAWRIKVRRIVFTDKAIKEATDKGYFSAPSHILKTNPELHEKIFKPNDKTYTGYPLTIIEGITREKFEYPAIKLLFGVKDYYYDWSF